MEYDHGAPAVGYACPRDFDGSKKISGAYISFKPFADWFPLIRESDHLAALAEKDAEVKRLREALEEAKTFHVSQDKALSKKPPSSESQWRRYEHQEQIDIITEVLTGAAS